MPYQPLGLGTPNNNDGDSLYAGGVKINSNFTELYTALAGTSGATLKIATGTAPTTASALIWSAPQQKFIPVVADTVRATGTSGINAFFVTNASGASGNGVNDLSSNANIAVLRLESRNMLFLHSRGNSSPATTRGTLDINLGNANVTSLSVYTTGVVVRGLRGLELYRSSAEDVATYTKLLDSTSTATGVTLYQTPVLDLASVASGVRTGSDSSNALAHTGFVKVNVAERALSSTQINVRRGLVATGSSLTASWAVNIDGIYHPKHIEGLIYNYNTIDNKVTLVTGAAAHWSYSTSGVAGVDGTSAIAIVASYTPIVRTFSTGWTPEYNAAGSTAAVIDGSISANTWYYLYYLGALSQHTVGSQTFYPGSSNVVISSNRDIASVNSQLNAAGYGAQWAVCRRLGPVRSNSAGTGLVPFNIKRIDHGGFEYYWGLNPNSSGAAGGADTSYTLTIVSASNQLKIVGSSTTYTLQDYSSAVLTLVPPIPGITAHLTIRHKPAGGATASLPELRMFGESWTVNSSISALNPPFEVVRSMATGLTCLHNIHLPMSPDGCYIPDGEYGGAGILRVTTSTGLILRYIFQNPTEELARPQATSQLLQITTTGFRIAR